VHGTGPENPNYAEGTKRCPACKVVLPLSAFTKRRIPKGGQYGGYYSWCKKCSHKDTLEKHLSRMKTDPEYREKRLCPRTLARG
jgi:hypothetical protein